MSLFNMGEKAYLMLADGRIFEGYSFGAKGTAYGEIVFSTSMTGYQEALTDPSYYGQILTQTFPLIGNYGVNDEDYESDAPALSGYVVREWCNAPSNFRCQGNIDEFMKKHGVVGIHSIDTRCLTRIIRENGAMNGVITTEDVHANKDEFLKKIAEYKIENAVKAVTVKEQKIYSAENGKFNVAMLDFGHTKSFRYELISRGCNVTVLPAETTAEQVKALNPDGIVLSAGAGDPAENTEIIANIREILGMNIPVFGTGLGHQFAALAMGAKTEKMKHGHRGASQPVKETNGERTFVTAQNHGYAVKTESLASIDCEITHTNANDGSCEGIRYKNIPCFTLQFYPKVSGGPQETVSFFDDFIAMMNKEDK